MKHVTKTEIVLALLAGLALVLALRMIGDNVALGVQARNGVVKVARP